MKRASVELDEALDDGVSPVRCGGHAFDRTIGSWD